MKNKLILTILVTLILGMTINVSAANYKDELEGYGGLSYYTFDEDKVGEDSSVGFFTGIRKWNSDKLAFGAEFNYTSYDFEAVEYDGFYGLYYYNVDVSLIGLLGTLTYKLSDNISLNGALGYYSYDVDSYELDSDSESDLGIKFGIETAMPLSTNMDFVGKISYRVLEIEDADFDGLELSTGFTVRF
ncbi:outer membrane beta-barrel protein [Orenia marismortui]|uniref:outer membrane beta-barrel protein n=1 Tax=Orenia marismortui TaxID=46469 RepID=UPI000380DDA7|nr:outer membrane beta-barrel protein [Orenia marismortui]